MNLIQKLEIETPRTDAEARKGSRTGTRLGPLVKAKFARILERETIILCDFINREMRMTGTDPRLVELENMTHLKFRQVAPDGKKQKEKII